MNQPTEPNRPDASAGRDGVDQVSETHREWECPVNGCPVCMPPIGVLITMEENAEFDRLRAENGRLRGAGERMWQRLADGGCGHPEPRAPYRKGCLWCASTAQAMDDWDAAIRLVSERVADHERTQETG